MKSPTPESYMCDHPPVRIIGEECEYNIQHGAVNIYGYISPTAVEAAGLRHLGPFLSNGAKLYPDVGHLEYCTPECDGPDRAAAASMAGRKVLAMVVGASGLPHEGIYRISGTALRDPTDDTKYTNGVHENFMFPRAVAQDPIFKAVIPSYLATAIWAMNGSVTDSGYSFSQKMPGIGGAPIAYSIGTGRRTIAGDKPMILVPTSGDDADTVGNYAWARMERRFADPQLSPEGKRISLAATSLVLRLVEQQHRLKTPGGNFNFEDVAIKRPLAAARMFMNDLTLSKTVEVYSGKQMTAADIGEQLATMALWLTHEVQLPADETRGASRWHETVGALRRSNPIEAAYDPFLLKTFDIAAKHRSLYRNGLMGGDMAKAKTLSLLWDRIVPDGVGIRYWQKLRLDAEDRCQFDQDVEQLVRSAPPTRAAVRARYIKKHAGDPFQGVNWAKSMAGSEEFSDAFGNVVKRKR